MLFAVWATDKAGALADRLRVREAHRARLRSVQAPKVLAAGPTLSPEAKMNGTLLIVEAASVDDVQRFVAGDPYVDAGVYADVQIRPWNCGLGPWAAPTTLTP